MQTAAELKRIQRETIKQNAPPEVRILVVCEHGRVLKAEWIWHEAIKQVTLCVECCNGSHT